MKRILGTEACKERILKSLAFSVQFLQRWIKVFDAANAVDTSLAGNEAMLNVMAMKALIEKGASAAKLADRPTSDEILRLCQIGSINVDEVQPILDRIRAVPTRDVRSPKVGEWYILEDVLGKGEVAYKATNDRIFNVRIAMLVLVKEIKFDVIDWDFSYQPDIRE